MKFPILHYLSVRSLVAPFAGAWIEIYCVCCFFRYLWSLPSRERGLKLIAPQYIQLLKLVAPFAGAWIEICVFAILHRYCNVAPFAGAWIEIMCQMTSTIAANGRSLRGSVD